jgi:hypothetical protein
MLISPFAIEFAVACLFRVDYALYFRAVPLECTKLIGSLA